MKSFYSTLQALVILLCGVTLFLACSKNAVSSASKNTAGNNMSLLSAPSTTLVLQPGPTDGQDVYVYKLVSNPNSVNVNFNDIPELGASKWTNGGSPETKRFYIKFTGLSAIPDSARIISATLQFFGLTSSLSTPQGNSVYSGSPYGNYPNNSCLVQRVVGSWDQSTLTWATQPLITQLDQAVIPSSNAQWNYNPVIDVKNMVQHMVGHPVNNYGFEVSLSREQKYRSIIFGSCETTDATKRPTLIVIYRVGSGS